MGLVVGGTLLTAGSVFTVLVAKGRIDDARSSLGTTCGVWAAEDSCHIAKSPELQTEAQRQNDALATWKPLRTVAYVALGTGLLTAGVGVLLWSTGSRWVPAQGGKRTGPVVDVGSDRWLVGWTRSF
jgi:hypothetical protein